MMADSTAPPNANDLARLFPLPNLVLFPQIVQGLHIFEPRYRHLMADTLAGDMQFALVLLKPDWENDYDARPPIEPIACLGKVIAHEKMNDGRYNLQIRGMSRIRILEELDDDKPYRTARFEPLSDIVPSQMSELTALRNEVATAILARFPEGGTTHKQIEELIHSDTPLGPLCDIFAYSLPLPLELKQQLLAECDVTARATQLAAALRLPQPGRRFPPEFSAN